MTRKGAMAFGLAAIMIATAGPACAHGYGHHDRHDHGRSYGQVDFGTETEKLLLAQSEKLFGIRRALEGAVRIV